MGVCFLKKERLSKLKIKTFAKLTTKKLDEEVNDFCANTNIKVIDIQINMTWLFVTATVIYED